MPSHARTEKEQEERFGLLRECSGTSEPAGLANWAKEYGSPSERAFENLVESFRPRARAIVGFHKIPPEDADDLVQQTYLTYLSRWQEVRNPTAWLAGTLRKRCLMFWRARRQSWLSTVDDAVLDARPSPGAIPQRQVGLRLDLARIVARLPERSQRLVELRYGWGCGNRETAERLGYKYSGIYTITKRCLQALAAELVAEGWCDDEARSGFEAGGTNGRGGEGTAR